MRAMFSWENALWMLLAQLTIDNGGSEAHLNSADRNFRVPEETTHLARGSGRLLLVIFTEIHIDVAI